MSDRLRRLVPLAAAGALLLAGCTDSANPAESGSSEEPHWTYAGAEGPANWGKLSDEYIACIDGSEQSPIDLPPQVSKQTGVANFHDAETSGVVADTGHSLQFTPDETGASITYHGKSYQLAQYHVHTPAEHTRNGKPHEAEAHLVFQNGEKLLVTGVWIDEGKRSPVWQDFLDSFESGEDIDVDIADLFPNRHNFKAYEGSLTTPPCSEGVQWLVMDQAVELSADQIEALHSVHGDNARPTQRRVARTVSAGHMKVTK